MFPDTLTHFYWTISVDKMRRILWPWLNVVCATLPTADLHRLVFPHMSIW